jgi:hypothetical protein
MPLLDHFHPPLLGRRHWDSFHGWWAAEMAGSLNEILPEEYFAEFQVTLSANVEVDVATLKENGALEGTTSGGGVATSVSPRVWAPPSPVAVMPAVFPDDFEVQVFSNTAGPVLAAAIELVSPGNKDRPETRRAFAVKCAAYLQRGVGVIVVDIVTSRHANMHDELMGLLGHGEGFLFPAKTLLYATAYRPVRRHEKDEIDLWRESLELQHALPTLPLAVRGLGCLPIDLEETYMKARSRGRVG